MSELSSPLTLMLFLAAVGIAPFIAVLVSSFVKIVVVIYLLRNALGVQQIPPNMAVNGLAIILSLYIMAPVMSAMYTHLQSGVVDLQSLVGPDAQAQLSASIEPAREFLLKHSDQIQRDFFARTTSKLWPQPHEIDGSHLLVLLPAFTVSELTSAFEVGFLLYLPFVVVDLIVANVLMAMGMIMVPPMSISLPLKLLLFVLVDGWTRLIHGLVLSYQ